MIIAEGTLTEIEQNAAPRIGIFLPGRDAVCVHTPTDTAEIFTHGKSLIPALAAQISGTLLPAHVRELAADGARQVRLIDAVPIGANVHLTVATYANVHDELRKIYVCTAAAKESGARREIFPTTRGSFAA